MGLKVGLLPSRDPDNPVLPRHSIMAFSMHIGCNESIRGLKNAISGKILVHFRCNFRRKFIFWEIFIAPKDSFLNFKGSLLSNF